MAETPDDVNESSTPADLLTACISERDGVVIVALAGELDMSTVDTAAAALKEATSRDVPVVVDLIGLRFFSSAGLTLLMRLHEQPGARVHLAGDHRIVTRPLEITGLIDLFPVHGSVTEAVAAAVG